jgi:hypothetical protein
MFLDDQIDEVVPTVQYGGVTLVRQNIKFKCETENSAWVASRSEVSDLEGYFCVLNFVGSPDRVESMPRSVRINVKTEGSYSNQIA